MKEVISMEQQSQTIDAGLLEQIKAAVAEKERKVRGRRIRLGKQAAKERRAAEKAQD
jgi:DNA invertase Pin-like site-specific DNA recombinase